MSKTMEQLLEDVLSSPDEDAPRLAYADACEDRGDEIRARFIRLQIEAIHKKIENHPTSYEPALSAYELIDVHGPAWASSIRERVASYSFYRGFVESIKIDASKFLDSAPELYSLAPVRKLVLTGVRQVAERLFSSPHLERIVSLHMEFQKLGDREIEMLAASPYVRRLVYLGLSANEITLAGVEALAASTKLPSLKDVDFLSNPAEIVKEDVWADMGGANPLVYAQGSLEGEKLEAKYGRKTWLHAVEDHGFRIPVVHAEC